MPLCQSPFTVGIPTHFSDSNITHVDHITVMYRLKAIQ